MPGCRNFNWTVRECVKSLFNNNPSSPPYDPNNYSAIGIKGVRFFFGLMGGASSTVFNSTGGILGQWENNLKFFLQDLRSYGIERVTPQPVLMGDWSGPLTKMLAMPRPTCPQASRELNFYPWLPFGFDPEDNNYPDRARENLGLDDSYNCSPINPLFDAWGGFGPYLALVDKLITTAQTNNLTITDFEIEQELNVRDFPVEARLIAYTPSSPGSYSPKSEPRWQQKNSSRAT